MGADSEEMAVALPGNEAPEISSAHSAMNVLAPGEAWQYPSPSVTARRSKPPVRARATEPASQHDFDSQSAC